MNVTAYQLVQKDSNGEPVYDSNGLPIASGGVIQIGVPRWGREKELIRESIRLRTEKGRTWIYPKYKGRRWRLVYRTDLPGKMVTLQILRTLDQAVDGDKDPFLFYERFTDSPANVYFVRMAGNFREYPEQPISKTGPIKVVQSVDFTLELFEEPIGTQILA